MSTSALTVGTKPVLSWGRRVWRDVRRSPRTETKRARTHIHTQALHVQGKKSESVEGGEEKLRILTMANLTQEARRDYASIPEKKKQNNHVMMEVTSDDDYAGLLRYYPEKRGWNAGSFTVRCNIQDKQKINKSRSEKQITCWSNVTRGSHVTDPNTDGNPGIPKTSPTSVSGIPNRPRSSLLPECEPRPSSDSRVQIHDGFEGVGTQK